MPNYNPYFPATYQPYQPIYQAPIQQPIQPIQPMQTAPVQTQQNSMNGSGIIWVANSKEAAMFPVGPNNAVALWDSGNPVVYLKQADASGKPTMKVYDLVERTETAQEAHNGQGEQNTTYATKEDLAAVVGVVKGFDGVISGIKSEIDKMSGDLYGIAGSKKKTAAKKETEDDA